METFNSVSILFLFLILLLTIYWYYKIPKNIPPGPLGLPLVGSLPFLTKRPYLAFINLGKIYGNVFHIYLGSTLVVVLNDFEAIKEAFVKQAEIFSGRIDDPLRKLFKDSYLGVIQNDGEHWRQHRRFLISNLRSNGVGKHALEPRIMTEVHYFIEEIRKTCGKPTEIKHLLNYSLLNNVLLLANHTRCNYDNEKLINFVDKLNRLIRLAKSVAIGSLLPWVSKIPGSESITKINEICQEYNAVLDSAETLIKDRNEDDPENTYIKAFMEERNKRLKHSQDEDIFTERALLHNTRDLLAAGGETSSTLLSWIMLYLTKYPKVQTKALEEIDKTIGRDREVTYDDRLLTPYVEAIIMEAQRIVTLVPLSIPHRNIRETTLFGYTIPANTMIFPNIYAVHYDPKLWGDPENFKPERFIDESGQLVKPEYLIPFSMGKRACAGEPLARMELYLYIVTFLQNFKLVPTKSHQSLEAFDLTVRQPVCDLICFQQR